MAQFSKRKSADDLVQFDSFGSRFQINNNSTIFDLSRMWFESKA